MVLEAVRYDTSTKTLQVLDQLQLPHITHYDEVSHTTEAWAAIKEMRTRGAPAIAIVAALALVAELHRESLLVQAEDVKQFVEQKLDYLLTSRPTAVNLGDASSKLKKVVNDAANESGATGDSVKTAYILSAEKMLKDDVSDNKAIGQNGAEWIMKNTERGKGGKVSVLTHCNTGSLATAGYGTALGVIRSLHADGNLIQAFCTETRPYNQGSRLTAYELVHDKIPGTLIADSMAAALLKLRGEKDRIAAIVVGADRVAENGDTANKIGTYGLAVLAKSSGVKFLVAAPLTSIDLSTPSGQMIPIEERPGKELMTATTAEGINTWNPAFDVTPAELIDGIISEVGVAEKDSNGKFHLRELFDRRR